METQIPNDIQYKTIWKASLSNGETFFENKGKFSPVPGAKSAWQRLIDYSVEVRAEITSLALVTHDGRTFNFPSAGKNPKFSAFNTALKPIDYNICRVMARDMKYAVEDGVATPTSIKVSDLFTVAEAIFSDYKLQIWVDEGNNKNSWISIVPHVL